MRIRKIAGFEIHLPTSGGKAGKGHAKTCSLQVRKDDQIVKLFRFSIDEIGARAKAMEKACRYCLTSK